MASAMAVSPDQQQQPPAGSSCSPSSPPLGVHVHETTLVPPPSPSPPETSLPLTFFDVYWLNSPPVERLFIYRLAAGADIAAIVSTLKASLQQALRAFFPLAGRLRLTPGTSDRYELHYRPGDAVSFTVADCDAVVDDLAADEPREVSKLAALVPPLPEHGRVFAVQATILLPARRGLAVGVTVHHAACDGSSSTHFLHTWAASAAAEPPSPPLSPPPVIDRTLLADPTGLYDVFVKAAPSSEDCEFIKMSADQLFATLTLSKDDLSRVKAAVAAEAARRGGAAPPPRCSSLVAAFGLVWSCYQRAAKNDEVTGGSAAAGDGEDGRSPTVSPMVFPVDHRSRMRPAPLPEKYFGNCVGPAFATAPKADLAVTGAGGIFSACAAVAAAIDEAVGEVGTPAAVGKWMDRVMEVVPLGPLSVAGSPRFRVYDLDFGFGRPAKVDVVSVARTGAVAIAESRSGDGGIEVGVSLQPAAMERFRKCFVDAVAWLRQSRGRESDTSS